MSDQPILELEHVTVVRGGRPVLSDFTLVLRHPEHVAIVGPNGAGKSTLLRVLMRECYPVPDPRSVCRILGRDRWNVFELRRILGIVSNELAAALDATATVEDAVLSGYFSSASLEAYHHVTPKMRATAARAMERTGIAALAARPLGTLSSGEVRRTTIARALVHDPRVLVFDEPSNSLDLAGRAELRSVMTSLAHAGVSIVLVTHHLEDVIPEIDRCLLVSHGRIVADGSKAELFTPQRLMPLFGVRELEITVRDGIFYAR